MFSYPIHTLGFVLVSARQGPRIGEVRRGAGTEAYLKYAHTCSTPACVRDSLKTRDPQNQRYGCFLSGFPSKHAKRGSLKKGAPTCLTSALQNNPQGNSARTPIPRHLRFFDGCLFQISLQGDQTSKSPNFLGPLYVDPSESPARPSFSFFPVLEEGARARGSAWAPFWRCSFGPRRPGTPRSCHTASTLMACSVV